MTTPEQKVQAFFNTQVSLLLDELVKPNGRPSISLKTRSRKLNYTLNHTTNTLDATSKEDLVRVYSWPGETVEEMWKFAVIVRILGHISEAIRLDFETSKRDIFYLDPVGFHSQRVVDRCIDDIAFTIGVSRAVLHVTAGAKGLTTGGYEIKLNNNIVMDVSGYPEGVLVPRVEAVEKLNVNGIKWILVVEKEAVFHYLATSKYYANSTAGKGVIITGKGYPDLCTRSFLRLLSSHLPTTPVYVLVDSDPDGMAIMSTYKYGSRAQIHQNADISTMLIEWLGLRSIKLITNREDEVSTPLYSRDRKKAQDMLARNPVFAEDGPEQEWRAELQKMLILNVKAELEWLYERPGGLKQWLDEILMDISKMPG